MVDFDNNTETQTEEVAKVETPVTPQAEAAPEQEEAAPAEDQALENDVESELKTVRKALDKRNRYINNQRNRIRALEAEIEKTKSEFSGRKFEAPQLEKFDSVIDYMKADQASTLEQKLAEQEHKHQLSAFERQREMALQQQAQDVAVQVQELLSSSPEFKSVISANANVIQQMPPHIEKIMAELDDSPAATFALAKEGRLQSLYSMPPEIAVAHLVQAEIRGQQYLQASVPAKAAMPAQQQAPKPIGSLRGASKSNTKTPDDMSPDQLMSWLKS